MTATLCAACRRIVWTTDVDATGRCVLCRPDEGATAPVRPRRKLAPIPIPEDDAS